jgi:mannose-6-phosphate isomerase-like protein (cupin superfamily)
MASTQPHYTVASYAGIETLGRLMFKDRLGLTGLEMSVNELPAGMSVPFVHAHKRNEEVYVVMQGTGLFYVDGEEFAIEPGSVVRVSPAGERCLKAGEAGSLRYLCIQAEAGSLVQATENDGVMTAAKPSWL